MIMSMLKCQNVLGLTENTISSNDSANASLNAAATQSSMLVRFELAMIPCQFWNGKYNWIKD